MSKKRAALVVASYQYEDEHLSQLVAPPKDAQALSRVLKNPDIGGFEVKTLINQPSHEVELAIEDFFDDRKPNDLLLLYFTGHGIKDQQGRLYYATPNTRRRRLRSTAIAAATVNEIMRFSRSKQQVLILDCCHSGAFAKGMIARSENAIGSTVGINEQLGGRGRVVLTASDALQYAFEGDDVKGEGVGSVFTNALVQGLETWEADQNKDDNIDLDELYDYVYDHVTTVTPQQRPEKWNIGLQGKIIIATRSHLGDHTGALVIKEYPKQVVEDLVRLNRRIKESGLPPKIENSNLLIGSWNIRSFGSVYKKWSENPGSPKRNLRAMAYIAEIVKYFDVILIQEVKSDTSALRLLLDDFLGDRWGVIYSDVSSSPQGNAERLAFIYDRRRVFPTGLAGEITLRPTEDGDPLTLFDRTPYIVGFQSGKERFALLTAHIKYGNVPEDRMDEIRNLAEFIIVEIRYRARTSGDDKNLIVLGDYNIDDRGDNPLFQAFVSTGLVVPPQLQEINTTLATKPKFYNQIGWFMGNVDFRAVDRAGIINFVDAVYKELNLRQMSYRLSDHFPVWVEFIIDRSDE